MTLKATCENCPPKLNEQGLQELLEVRNANIEREINQHCDGLYERLVKNIEEGKSPSAKLIFFYDESESYDTYVRKKDLIIPGIVARFKAAGYVATMHESKVEKIRATHLNQDGFPLKTREQYLSAGLEPSTYWGTYSWNITVRVPDSMMDLLSSEKRGASVAQPPAESESPMKQALRPPKGKRALRHRK